MSEQSARQRFVEAMRHFLTDSDHWSVYEDGGKCCVERAGQIADAFADAECAEQKMNDGTLGYMAPNGDFHEEAEHAVCRANLKKDIGLE